jgi:hypothetical protein
VECSWRMGEMGGRKFIVLPFWFILVNASSLEAS